MGTIVERKRKNGTVAYLAQISINRDGKRVHSESRTFERRPAAAAWLKKRERELEEPGALGKTKAETDVTLAKAIDRYTEESLKDIGRTKAQVLRSIKGYGISDKRCSEITSKDIVEFAGELSGERLPQTVGNYLSHLSAVFAIARPAWGFELDQQAMKDALAVTKRLGVTKKSNKRDRRPTLTELDKILDHFEVVRRRRPSTIPMVKIVLFALFSTRRQDEITRIKWADLDDAESRILVRDMKHPGDKAGNDTWVQLPPEALEVIRTMPKVKDEIFPFTPTSISAAFTRAIDFLMIDDLIFHDLRHEGVSRLFEMGWSIPKAADVSGHRSWASLKRYTHLRHAGDKYANWQWQQRIA